MQNLIKILSFFLLSLVLIPGDAFGADQGAAKVIIARGKVVALINGKPIVVKRGTWLPEGAEVQTEKKSFAKLLFIDKSTMNVGPESQMKIDSFPKKEAGIITLVKGQVRSKVTKNYMDMSDKDKSKLFIKTKTAAMGVRGTDFQVSFNPINLATSLVTFEGAVAMAKLMDGNLPSRGMQRSLEKMVSSPAAVMVRRGQYSGSSPKLKQATIPIKISPVQLETLEKNDTPGMAQEQQGSSVSNKPAKKFRSVVPPGMDSKIVANDASSVDKVMADTVGSGTVKVIEKQVAAEIGPVGATPPPEGSVNLATGAIAPTAGGFVDLGTALYIPPPEGSTFDANAGVYVPPADLGRVDPVTGDFVNDNFDLNPDGGWSEKPPEGTIVDNNNGSSRTVASTDNGGEATSADSNPVSRPGDVNLLPTIGSDMNTDTMELVFVSNEGPLLGENPEGQGGDDSKDGSGDVVNLDPTTANNGDDSGAIIDSYTNPTNDISSTDPQRLLLNNGLTGSGTTRVNFDVIVTP